MSARTYTRSKSRRGQWLMVLVAVGGTLWPSAARAQGLTGALVGTVKDERGAVLAGALVRLTSPALVGGPDAVTTNERGEMRFPVLLPGVYAIDIELAGFAPYHEKDIYVGAAATLSRVVVLKVAGVAESIVVEGSQLEARSSGFETRIGSDYLRAIPTRRYSMFDAIRVAPGVSPTSQSSGTVNTVSAFGSGANENLFLIDGTNFTCPCAGVSRAEPSVDTIEEVQVQSVGVSPEYGNIQGAVFNVVTKQGGDRFQGDTSYYGQWSGLTSKPVVLTVPGTPLHTGYEREKYRDYTADVGGPAVPHRLWFFAGYQYLRDYDSQPGTDPSLPRRYEQNKGFGKLTWRLRPGLQLVQSFNYERWVNPQIPTLVTPFVATQRPHASVPTTTFGHLTQTLSADTVWDVRVGRFVFTREDDPSSGDRTEPNRFDRVTGVSSGNVPVFGSLKLIRTTAKATLTHYQRGFLGLGQDWKIGMSFERGEHYQPQVIPGGVRYVDNHGQPFQAISSAPSITGGEFVTAAAFASDTITIGDRLTVNLGVRYDHSRAISQDLHAVDLNGNQTGDIVNGSGTLYTWNVVSPRLGVTAKLSPTGRTMLRASYGRFDQGVLTGEIAPIHPGAVPVTTSAFNAATGGYTTLVSVVDPKVNIAIDPHTRTPRTDEYSIGVDHEVKPRLVAALAYLHKSGSNFIAWTDVGGQYTEDTRTLPDQTTLPVFVLTSPTASRRFLLTNPNGYSMAYNGLVAVIEKRRSHGWHALGSYTFSRASGLQTSSAASAADAQASTVAPAFPSATTFGRDPNNLTNAYGRLPNDRPHMFRLMGTVDVPHTGVTLATNLNIISGKPWAETAQISLPQGDQRILLEPRGSRRLPTQSLLDLRVSKSVPFGQLVRADLLIGVLNVLNDTAVEGIATDNKFSPNLALPTVYVDPRRAMLALRLNLGR